MKVDISRDNIIELTEVYNSIVLKTNSGELLYIAMRDDGFEITYKIHPCDKGHHLELKNDKIT